MAQSSITRTSIRLSFSIIGCFSMAAFTRSTLYYGPRNLGSFGPPQVLMCGAETNRSTAGGRVQNNLTPSRQAAKKTAVTLEIYGRLSQGFSPGVLLGDLGAFA